MFTSTRLFCSNKALVNSCRSLAVMLFTVFCSRCSYLSLPRNIHPVYLPNNCFFGIFLVFLQHEFFYLVQIFGRRSLVDKLIQFIQNDIRHFGTFNRIGIEIDLQNRFLFDIWSDCRMRLSGVPPSFHAHFRYA